MIAYCVTIPGKQGVFLLVLDHDMLVIDHTSEQVLMMQVGRAKTIPLHTKQL